MAGNKKDSNTSKTAHVMNLISRGRGTKPPSDETTPEVQTENAVSAENPVVQPAAPQVSPIISIMNADAKASSVIKDALEESLLAQLASEENAVSDEPSPPKENNILPDPMESSPVKMDSLSEDDSSVKKDPVPEETKDSTESVVSETPSSMESFVSDEPIASDEPLSTEEKAIFENPSAVSENILNTTIPAEEPEMASALENSETPNEDAVPEKDLQIEDRPNDASSSTEQKENETVPRYVNVMEDLVEKNIDKYIKMFGLCTCAQCRADVAALALTNLVPQYIVAPENEISFRMVIYENRFHAEVTAQILHACKTVMDSPRHNSI